MTATVHQLPTERRRRANYTGCEPCATCDDTGQVIVGTETHGGAAYEQVGPCPFCERGFRLEFGIGRRRNHNGGLEEEKTHGGPWGRDGFWKGRPIPEGLA